MSTTKIWKITWKKKKAYLVGFCRSRVVLSEFNFLEIRYWTVLKLAKKPFFVKVQIFGISCILACLFFPSQTLISLLSLGTKFVNERRKERLNTDKIFPVKNGIPVFRVHPQSFSIILNIQVEYILSDCDYEKLLSDVVKLCYWRASICTVWIV